ncbi:MAG: hypothetical protein FWF34_01905 [Alphaproteobacteria bacterium]|nr:hypothetical protein [Alphaproteobacteria bacterium]
MTGKKEMQTDIDSPDRESFINKAKGLFNTPTTPIHTHFYCNGEDLCKYGDYRHLANLHVNYADNAVGTIYYIHGYHGSPIEEPLSPLGIAAELGYNCAFIESVTHSLTAKPNGDNYKYDQYRHLPELRLAIDRALAMARKDKKLGRGRQVVLAHSMGCRGLTDLIVSNKKVRAMFEKIILADMYMLTDPRLLEKTSHMNDDELNEFKAVSRNRKSNINGEDIQFKATIGDLFLDDPCKFDGKKVYNGEYTQEYIDALFEVYNFAQILGGHQEVFLLAAGASRQVSMKMHNLIYETIDYPLVTRTIIPGADHYFKKTPKLYKEALRNQLLDFIAPSTLIR